MKVPFQMNSNMLNRVEIWAVGRVFVNSNAMSFKEKSDNLHSIYWSMVLLEFGIANGAIYVCHDWEEEHLEEAMIDKCIDRTNH